MLYWSPMTYYPDIGLLALRLAVGFVFLYHGLKKRGMWKMQASPQMPAGMLNMMRLLSIAEPLGGIAMIVGFLTPFAAAGFIIIMLGAIYHKIKNWKVSFFAQDKTGWEFDFVLLAASIALLLLGPGSFSVDAL